jgi:hypothetical protein
MARYKLGKTEIDRKKAFQEFNGKEISSFAVATMFLEEPYHFVPMPQIDHKIVMSPYKQDTIDFYYNKEFTDKERDEANLGDAQIIDLCNMLFPDLPDKKTAIEVFLKDGDVVILDGELVDPSTIAEKIEPELDFIVSLSVNKNKTCVEDYLILTEDNNVKHVTNQSIGKLFIPYMGDWFEAKFPGVTTGKDADDSQEITENGLKLLLSLFVNEKHAHISLAKETLPREGKFSVNLKELQNGDLSNGLTTQQLNPFIKFLKGQNEDIKPRNPSMDFFAERNVITNPLQGKYIQYETVSWLVFTNHYNRFPMGCTIVLAPGQVITDKKDNEIFCFDDVHELYYKGPEALSEHTRNSIQVLCKGDSIDNDLRKRMIKYFQQEFKLPVQSLSTVKRMERG